ncbi:MAG TPA: peptidylprolyl isomerase [Coleofasciculaceae cyanobacterium]|jgi:cyclophilin family peptidyl-prolyl cis-trans isomerase
MIQATIETDKGTIRVALDDEKAPITVQNFVDLAKSGFYDGLTFHRVEPGFVIQGGDPRGNGTGGSDKEIPLEIWAEGAAEPTVGKTLSPGQKPVIKHDTAGVISMARTNDPNSATSQFFLTLGNASFLDGQYAAFGKSTDTDVIQAIRKGDKMVSVTIEP